MATVMYPPAVASLLARIDALATSRGLRCYAVGGTVRDALLSRAIADVDVAVNGDACAFARGLADELAGHYVELDDEEDVARVVLPGAGDVKHVDIAALHGPLADDLRRRDFTIDALAAPMPGGEVTDVCGGVGDIERRIVRMTSRHALADDPLRLMRAVRIAGELGFGIEDETAATVRTLAPRVVEAAGERRRDELARMLALPETFPAVRRLDALGLLDALIPELADGRGVTQPENHHSYDVFEHGLRAVEAMDWMLAPSPPNEFAQALWDEFSWAEAAVRGYMAEAISEGRTRGATLKLAALLHDIAKPATRTLQADGRIRFFGHADAGAQIAARIMRRFRFAARETAFVRVLVAEHLRPVQLAAVGEVPTRRALYRFYRDLGDAVPAVLFLALADAAASRGSRMTLSDWRRHARYMSSLLVRSGRDAGIVDPPRLLTGRDIMSRFGLPEGPRIGRLLEELREAQAAGEVSDQREALAFVGGRIEDITNGDDRAP